jgi:GTPase
MKFYSKPVEEHPEVPNPDEGRLEELVNSWEQRQIPYIQKNEVNNKCYIISLEDEKNPFGQQQLAEIISLVRTQGDQIAAYEIIKIIRANPKTVIGSGKLKEIAARVIKNKADLLVLDIELSPSQMRNIEDVVGVSVCDREAVILNVFMKHARSKKAKIQVEVAHLDYLRPRIRGLGLDMDQQASSIVTGRGPGETASAMLARKLDGRLSELKKALANIKKTNTTQHAGRSSCKQITLVGYTNAGKTSLMNRLAGTSLSVKNKPFETLETTTRCLSCYGGDVLLSDTVGFIRRLPERLFTSFESTLEGVKESSLLVVVVDISDQEKELHIDTTLKLLARLGAEMIPRLFVFNKTDLLENEPPARVLNTLSRGNKFTSLSSQNNDAVKALKNILLSEVRSEQRPTRLFIPYSASNLFSTIYSQCRVINTDAAPKGLFITVEGAAHIIAKIESRLSEVHHE